MWGALFSQARSHNREKAHHIRHVRLSAPTIAVPTRWIFLKFDIEDFYENLSRNPNLVIIGQKYRALYMNTHVPFIVPTNIKSPKQCRL